MDNKTQLQANNERIEALTELLKNKTAGGGGSGSGGLDINGVIEKCMVSDGVTVLQGDFINKSDLKSGGTGVYGCFDLIELSNNRYFVAGGHSTSKPQLKGAIISVDGNNYTVTSTTLISSDNSCQACPILFKLSDEKILIFHSYTGARYLYATFVNIDGTTMTVSNTIQVSSTAHLFYQQPTNHYLYRGAGIVNNDKSFVLFVLNSSSRRLYRVTGKINEDETITDVVENSVDSSTSKIQSLKKINDEKALLLYYTSNSNPNFRIISLTDGSTILNKKYTDIKVQIASNGGGYGASQIECIDENTAIFIRNDITVLKGETLDLNTLTLSNTVDIDENALILSDFAHLPTGEFATICYVTDAYSKIITFNYENGLSFTKSEAKNMGTAKPNTGNTATFALTYDTQSGNLLFLMGLSFCDIYKYPLITLPTGLTAMGVTKNDGTSGDLVDIIRLTLVI